MSFKLEGWGTFPKVGTDYATDINGKWCSFLETRKGAYRGDHTHPYDQYTVLLGGSAMVVKEIDGKIVEYSMVENEVMVTPKGVPHILVPLEDSVLYEWWQGPFETEACPGVFDEYTKNRDGPPV